MKFTLFTFLVSVSLFSNSQEPAEGVFPLKEGSILYEKVISIDSFSKDDIYKSVKSWGVSAFKSQKDVLQADDKETGLVAYKFIFTILFESPPVLGKRYASDWTYWATMRVYIKEGKAKITVSDVDIKDPPGTGTPSILTFRKDMDPVFKKAMYGKGGREKYYAEAKGNFIKANERINELILDLESAMKKGSREFDF
jgi:hypothetical protein